MSDDAVDLGPTTSHHHLHRRSLRGSASQHRQRGQHDLQLLLGPGGCVPDTPSESCAARIPFSGPSQSSLINALQLCIHFCAPMRYMRHAACVLGPHGCPCPASCL